MDNIKISFGRRLKLLRTQKGYSQEKFATISGLDRTYIGGVERGERNISLVNIQKIAIALKVEIEELFQDGENERNL